MEQGGETFRSAAEGQRKMRTGKEAACGKMMICSEQEGVKNGEGGAEDDGGGGLRAAALRRRCGRGFRLANSGSGSKKPGGGGESRTLVTRKIEMRLTARLVTRGSHNFLM